MRHIRPAGPGAGGCSFRHSAGSTFVGRIGFGQGVSNVPYFLLGVDQAEPDVRVIVAVFVDLFFIGEFDGRNALRGIDGVERRIFSGIDDFRCPGSMPRPLYTKSCD